MGWSRTAAILTAVLGAFVCVPTLKGEEHVVSRAQIHREIAAAQTKREAEVEHVRNFFESEPVKKALTAAHQRPEQIQKAIPLLSDAELTRLAEQSRKLERDLAAGALDNQQLTYIVIALAAAVVVLVAS